VIDEAAMVGTRTLAALLAHAQRDHAKVVLVGDDRQLPEIESGGAFSAIKDALPTTELSEVRRQPFGWERAALEMIREGRAKEALDAYLEHDRVVASASAEKTKEALLADWWERESDPEPAIMLAARRSQVDDLNARARAKLSAAGRLGGKSVTVAGREFAEGDRVMALRNTKIGVKNGTRGVVESIDRRRGEITVRTDRGASVTLPKSYLEAGHLTHAYAMTGHKAQGMTTDKALVLADETVYREWAYATMSRGRYDNRLYVVAGADEERDELGGQIAASEPLQELVRSLGKSRAKDLALDSYENDEAEWDSPASERELEGLERSLEL
jgi:ATP-dependent exoDNAse (exonuclease V) alpha subunit